MKTLKRALISFLIILCPQVFAADYYTASGDPVAGSALTSSVIRAEYAAIAAGFAKIAPYTSAGSRVLFINTGATAQTTDAELTYNGTTNLLTVNTSTFGLNTSIAGTLGVTGVATLTAQPILSSLTASLPVFTDASKGLVSNAMTGTGNVMMSASPTTTGTLTAAIANFSGLGTFNAGATVASGQTLTLTGATVAGQPTWSSAQTIPGIVLSGNITESGARAITITGALSAGAISGTTGAFSGAVALGTTGAVGDLTVARTSDGAAVGGMKAVGNDTVIHSGLPANVLVNIGASTIATVSSTGLAVTGALSATGNPSIPTTAVSTGTVSITNVGPSAGTYQITKWFVVKDVSGGATYYVPGFQ